MRCFFFLDVARFIHRRQCGAFSPPLCCCIADERAITQNDSRVNSASLVMKHESESGSLPAFIAHYHLNLQFFHTVSFTFIVLIEFSLSFSLNNALFAPIHVFALAQIYLPHRSVTAENQDYVHAVLTVLFMPVWQFKGTTPNILAPTSW